MNRGTSNYPAMSSLYVGDLKSDTTEAMLYEKFSTIGPILSVHICRDRRTKCSFGYAYVNYQKPIDAKRAYDTMNSEVINGRPIRVMWPRYNASLRNSNVNKVFIRNLDKSINSKLIFDTFSVVGTILNCHVAQNLNGESKGYGFVHFENQQAAYACILRFNGMIWNGKRIYVSRYIPRYQYGNQRH